MNGEVRFDAGSRSLYSTAASNYRQVPLGVVVPRTIDSVVAALEVCRRHDVPVLGRGGGTSLAGQSCNVAVVFDFSKYLRRIVDIDPAARRAVVEPGAVLDDLRAAAERHHLTFGPDPSTHEYCTLGGMIGNNSCGVHSVMAGRTSDNIEQLDVVTYDGLRLTVGPTSDVELGRMIAAGGRRGEIYRSLRDLRDRYAELIRARFPSIPRLVSGYALDQLLPEHGFNVARALVGSEGTCVLVLGATCRLVHSPPARRLVVAGYPDVYRAADDVPAVLAARPTGLEGIDETLVADMRRKGLPRQVDLLPPGRGWLLVEFGGEDGDEAEGRAREFVEDLTRRDPAVAAEFYSDVEQMEAVWEIRESGLGATARVPGEADTWEGWEDSAVAPERLGEYVRRLHELYERFGLRGALYGHFGDGCVHTRINFDLVTPDGVKRFRSFLEEATDLVVSLGGALSGEHGDGQARAEFLPKMFGPELVEAFARFKAIWDPDGRMNPHKVVDPYRVDEDLRLGPGYDPKPVRTYFQFPDDDGDFSRATQRCVGVGKCRRTDGGIMCPSYMVTREEEHSTRGRAHLLFDMLSGRGPVGGFRDDHVKDALDLCLACKGCRGECPVNVDIATYKAEFLAHYYAHRLRPRAAYAMGFIMYGAALAARSPGIANAAMSAPGLGQLLKRSAGIAAERTAPPFAAETFTAWFRRRPPSPPAGGRRRVIVWPDTFTNHFTPYIGRAAVELLDAAGFSVSVPRPWVCCGRPLYDFGFLRHARRLLQRTLRTLAADIEAGTPVVVLEPSCAAVFRDELVNLLPRRLDARRLATQTVLLSEFLDEHASDLRAPPLRRRALVQPHCHHKAVLGFDAEVRMLERLGLDVDVLDSGCRGMAGAFGFEASHYDVSMACAERVLLPAIRKADDDVLVVADGFSCREQIRQGAGRSSHHLAEVARSALRSGGLR
ncbi:MAG: FAD-linked oxidase C-terminal domain-containing protein [Actinomycetota bacterium]